MTYMTPTTPEATMDDITFSGAAVRRTRSRRHLAARSSRPGTCRIRGFGV